MATSKTGTSKHTTDTPSILTERINGHKNTFIPVEKLQLSVQSMKYCSRYEDCSAQKCPLDPLIRFKGVFEDDPKCEMAKPTRHKYWESMPDDLKSELEFEGYFEAEYNRMKSAKERWLALPEEKKAEIKARMSGLRKMK